LAGSIVYLRDQSPLPPDPPLAARQTGSPRVRVLWILFDEWDQRLTFRDRTPGGTLPVLDGLAGRSFTAARALAVEGETVPVSQMATTRALPSLLYGKRLTGSTIEDARTRRIVFADGSSSFFGAGDSIFAQVRSRGWNAAAAGWYLPYCRVFAAQLVDCYWDQKYEQSSSARSAVPEAAIDETRMLFETSIFSAFGTSLVADRHSSEYEALLAAARRYATDASIGLAFVHFNIPHTPYFYHPKIAASGRSRDSAALYDGALQLVDRSIGDILFSLKQAGLDSKTAIILSSDHPARFAARQDPHVPFLVRLPGEDAGVVGDQEFSTLETASLALAIASGGVRTPAEVADFLSGGHMEGAAQ
jgi:hypothetical protein